MGGRCGREEREEFQADVRAALLVAFAFFFITVSSKLDADPLPEVRDQIMNSIEWFAWTIQDWDCAESVGGVSVDKPPPKKRKYLKKSKRKAHVKKKEEAPKD